MSKFNEFLNKFCLSLQFEETSSSVCDYFHRFYLVIFLKYVLKVPLLSKSKRSIRSAGVHKVFGEKKQWGSSDHWKNNIVAKITIITFKVWLKRRQGKCQELTPKEPGNSVSLKLLSRQFYYRMLKRISSEQEVIFEERSIRSICHSCSEILSGLSLRNEPPIY